jgi:hypothetical protein
MIDDGGDSKSAAGDAGTAGQQLANENVAPVVVSKAQDAILQSV